MNKHIGMGRITRDIEIKTTGNGKKYARFSMALPGYKKDAPATFINYIAWDKAAEIIAQYCGKGSQLVIESEYTSRKYEKDGQTREAVEFRVVNFEFAGGSKGKGGNVSASAGSEFGSSVDEPIPF